MSLISSPSNERVKRARLLQRQARTRRKERRLVLEGVRLLHDAVQAGVLPEYVLHAPELDAPAQELVARLREGGVPCLAVIEPLLRDLAETETPQGVLGVFPWPALPMPAAPTLVLVADGWRDPGNLGTAIRAAAAAGADAVALTPGTVDPFNAKALRAGMGGHFRVPLVWQRVPRAAGGVPRSAHRRCRRGGRGVLRPGGLDAALADRRGRRGARPARSRPRPASSFRLHPDGTRRRVTQRRGRRQRAALRGRAPAAGGELGRCQRAGNKRMVLS
ncbi:MAG: hypothetical protein M5U29_14840 [Anaerolineae bacterium]|nr:hypothetical protein [Anaerolineae bacterium]